MNQPSEGRRACVTDSDDNDNDNDNDEAELVVPSDGERCILHRSLALPSTLFPTLSSPVGPHASTTPSHSLLFRLEATRSGAEARFACCKTKRIPFPFAAGTTASTQYQRHAPPMRRTHPLPPDIFAVLPRAAPPSNPACHEAARWCLMLSTSPMKLSGTCILQSASKSQTNSGGSHAARTSPTRSNGAHTVPLVRHRSPIDIYATMVIPKYTATSRCPLQ
ncbi:hypothetical protein DENSPDRAFT_886060 [Dentipellis sp. KUC8613]|nr:hypothetical protein DENSPDRAFT_886060 [Dentipellis sp. KUC8613]